MNDTILKPTTQEQSDAYMHLMNDILGPIFDRKVPNDQRPALLATPVTLPDGRETTVAKLTAEDIKAIVAYQQQHLVNLEAEAEFVAYIRRQYFS